jgi:hypothetical protein
MDSKMSVKLFFEDGTESEIDDLIFSSKDEFSRFALKSFLKKWPSRLQSVKGDVSIKLNASINDEGDIRVENESNEREHAEEQEVTHQPPKPVQPIPQKKEVVVVEPTDQYTPPPAPVLNERVKIGEKDNEIIYKPNDAEKSQRVDIVSEFKESQQMRYSPITGVPNYNLTIGTELEAVGYSIFSVERNETMAPDGKLKMIKCVTDQKKVLMIPEIDLIHAVARKKIQYNENSKMPMAEIPIHYMDEHEGMEMNRERMTTIKDSDGNERQVLAEVSDRIPLMKS